MTRSCRPSTPVTAHPMSRGTGRDSCMDPHLLVAPAGVHEEEVPRVPQTLEGEKMGRPVVVSPNAWGGSAGGAARWARCLGGWGGLVYGPVSVPVPHLERHRRGCEWSEETPGTPTALGSGGRGDLPGRDSGGRGLVRGSHQGSVEGTEVPGELPEVSGDRRSWGRPVPTIHVRRPQKRLPGHVGPD